MADDRIYKMTSIGRPLDPTYPTNRAVLLIVPFAGAIGSGVAGLRGAGLWEMFVAGLIGVAVAVGSWALGRELAPDANPAAFLGMAFAYATFLVVGPPSLWLLFTALALARMVNRSVGMPARVTDSIVVCGLVLWTAYRTQSALLCLVGALAFGVDAALRNPLRRQWLFAGICLTATVLLAFVLGYSLDELSLPRASTGYWLAATSSVFYAVAYFRTREVTSVGDVSGVKLSTARVRAGMALGLLVPAQAMATGPLELASALWATLAGVGVHSVIGLFRADRSQ